MDEVFAVVTDLFFISRIQSAAAAAGVRVRFVRPDGSIPEGARRLALVDLDASVDVRAAIRRLKEAGARSIVAFGPHLDTESRKAARSAGADRVLAKSKFVTDLPSMLATLATPDKA
jgi:DNA-binding LacI/PurR family transcriptional regulator